MKSKYVTLAVVSALVAACGGGSPDNRAPVNQAPNITAIADQSTVANNASQPIAFSVADEQVGSLAISVTSDRQQLVPDSGLSLDGSGTARALTVTPIIDMTGDAFITIIITDQEGLSASTSFSLAVNAEQKSMQQFARDTFATSEDDEPVFINAVEFSQDADDDDFADLLAQ